MKIKNLAWLLSLLMILSFSFMITSCSEDDDDNEPNSNSSNLIENILWVPTDIVCNCGEECTLEDCLCIKFENGIYYTYDSNDPNNLGEAEQTKYKIKGDKIIEEYFGEEYTSFIISSSEDKLVIKGSDGDIITYKAN
ncbi:MAG: hypothetical protein MJ211_07250 [Bacteroidales bacterium]|nr:hypothetical protein [Bacteroidales bacterium]